MLSKPLDEITEADLQGLQRDQITESLRLEFKRQLNTKARGEKLEIAKDVSAMANAAGGRILYGVGEIDLSDDSTAAGAIEPLIDGAVLETLENVIHSTIQPPPRFRVQKVNVSGGFVLIVEVYASYDRDLHMVVGYDDSRFYRRGERTTRRMTEPEIREAYYRLAASMQGLEASLERCVESELALVPNLQESVFVIPLFGHRRLVQPQQLGKRFGYTLANGPANFSWWRDVVPYLRVVNDGYRGWIPEDNEIREASAYASVLRNGVVHLARELGQGGRSGESRLRTSVTIESLITALVMAKEVFKHGAYWGPILLRRKPAFV